MSLPARSSSFIIPAANSCGEDPADQRAVAGIARALLLPPRAAATPEERIDEASQRDALVERVGQHPGHLGREPRLIGMVLVVLCSAFIAWWAPLRLRAHQDAQTVQDVLRVAALEVLRQVGGFGVVHDADRSRFEVRASVRDRA